MIPRRGPGDRVLVPMRAEAPDGTIGDGMVEIGPGDPGYEEALAEIEAREAADPKPPPPLSDRFSQPEDGFRIVKKAPTAEEP